MELGSDVILMGLAWYVVFIISATFHEAAHAFMAYRLGDPTAYHGGQVTLDPIPHIKREPFGMVILPWLSFAFSGWMLGWASCPYDPRWAYKYPKRSAVMAFSGPTSNLLLVLVAAGLIHAGILAGIFYAPESIGFSSVTAAVNDGFATGAAIFVSILFSLNLLLFVFNLMPVPPLDGRAIMEFFLEGRALEKYRDFTNHPNVRIFGILVAWYLFDYVFGPVHLLALNLLYPGSGYQ